MSTLMKPGPTSQRRIWKAPTSNFKWYWLALSAVVFIAIVLWYIYTVKTQQFPDPSVDPLRFFGIISFGLVLITSSYSLRRRFMRGLPGKVQSWLWMHTWLGVITILIAILHENFAHITHDFFPEGLATFTDLYCALAALYGLLFLVVSGITGRLLDIWQTRIIAHEASSNGVGIVRSVEERMLELEYTIERLSAGKSEMFKSYCLTAIGRGREGLALPGIPPNELADFERACAVIDQRAQLGRSHRRQMRAQHVITMWRSIHIVLASLSLAAILYHSIMELLTNVFHLLPSA
jgi:hypothetical protein